MQHNESVMFSPPPPMRDSLLTGGSLMLTDHGSSLLGGVGDVTSEITSELIIGNDFENNKKLTFLHMHEIAQNKLEDEESEASVMKSQLKKLLFLYQELSTKKMSMERLEQLDESGNVMDRFKGSMNYDESHVNHEKKQYKEKKNETNMLSEELETKTKTLHEKFAHLKSLKRQYEELFEKLENPDLLEEEDASMVDNTPVEQVVPSNIVDNHSQDADSQDNHGGPTVIDEDDDNVKDPKTLEEYLGDTRKRLSFSDVGTDEEECEDEEEEQDEEEIVQPVPPSKPIENLTILSAVNEFKFLKWSNNIEIIDCREFHSKQVVEVELKIPLSSDRVTKLDVVLSFNKHYKEPSLISVTCAQPISSQRIDFSDIIQRAIYLNDVPYLFSAISSRVRSMKK